MTPADDRSKWQWHLPVTDAGDRPRGVTVRVENGFVMSLTPPGEGFSSDPDEADLLAAVYKAAANRARRQRQEQQS
jgi:hypothetical protein